MLLHLLFMWVTLFKAFVLHGRKDVTLALQMMTVMPQRRLSFFLFCAAQ
jgi:hypothetical protein